MTYHGRHRAAPPPRHRLRSSGAVTAVATTALLAPIVTVAPHASHAVAAPAAVDTLVNHPEWRLPPTDPTAAEQIASLRRTLRERDVPFNDAIIGAYRVPTVDGWTTYVTARPELMQVRSNAGLTERTPEGVRTVPVTEVALNFGAAPDVVATIQQVQQIVSPMVAADLDLDALLARIKDLPIASIDLTGFDALVAQVQTLVQKYGTGAYDDAMESIARLAAVTDRPLPEPNAVVEQVKTAIGPLTLLDPQTVDEAKARIEALDVMGRIEELVRTAGMYGPEQFVNTLRTFVDSLPVPAIEPSVVPTVDPNAVLVMVNNLVRGVNPNDHLPDAAETIAQVQRAVAPYTQLNVDLDALLATVKALPVFSVDLTGVDAAINDLKGLVATYTDAAYGSAMQAIERIKAVTDRPLPDPNAVVEQVKQAVAPLTLTAVAVVNEAKARIEALDVMGRLAELVKHAGTYQPAEYVEAAAALIDSLPVPTLDPTIIPMVDPKTVVATVTKVVNGVSLSDFGALKSDVAAGGVVEVVPMAVAAAPPVAENLMVNPNMPAPLARDEPDGSKAYWATPPGAKDCFDVVSDAYKRLVCWQIDRQFEDNDPNRNFWQFHVDISGESVGYRSMERMWTEVVPQPVREHTQRWDAQPKPNARYGGGEGCYTEAASFSVGSGAPVQFGYAYTWERTQCETYMPKSYDDHGHWASIWEGNPKVADGHRRAVMLKAPVQTPSDKGVHWELWTGQRTSG